MFDQTTLAVAFAAVLLLEFAIALSVHRRASEDRSKRAERLDDGRLRCPNCETENEPGYRFCRECIGELRARAPTVPMQQPDSGSPFS